MMDTSVWSYLLSCLLLFIAEAKHLQQQTGPITCMVSRATSMDLSYKHLSKVPSKLPRTIQELDLSHNNISSLHEKDLEGLPDLCILKITHNGLLHISPSAFLGNIKLQLLNISFNALRTIPELSLPDLRVLDVSENLYGSYYLGKSYTSLLNLVFLALGSPQARSINLTDFASLHAIPLQSLKLSSGTEMKLYEHGSIAQLTTLQELALHMTFCENPEIFENILQDLNKTNAESLTLIKFVPDICNVSNGIFAGFRGLGHLKSLFFYNTWFNSTVMTSLVLNIIQSPIKILSFYNITFAQDTPEGIQIPNIPGYNKPGNIRIIVFQTIHHYQYNFPSINVNVTLFPYLNYVKFSGTGMSILPCNLISALPSLQVLDLSDNLLKERGLWWPSCSLSNVFPALKELYVRNNKFADLQFISNRTYEMKNLNKLDLSTNSLSLMGMSLWPPHLTELSLSDNTLGNAAFDYLSPYVETVNLSHTGITALTQAAVSQLSSLRHLFLSSNSISSLPSDLSLPDLEELHIDQNNINTLTQKTVEGLPRLKRLRAGRNPFGCNCDIAWFVTSFNKTLLTDWPSDYTCSSPHDLAGMALENYHPGWVTCTPWIQAVISIVIIVIVTWVLGYAFYTFDGAWYLQMLWVWLRVKRRGYQEVNRLRAADFKYHAFISYSQKDSEWVDTQLVPNLEAANFNLCIHERDFVPGDWIIDNIINCVEDSYKTLFVLSQNFVQSEWCNYELFFAQHRALSIQQDSLVFILLEPIPADSLPKKFLKLRTLLRQQTYMEWHKDERKQQVFWTSLKAMLQVADKRMVLERVAKEVTDLCHLLNENE
ncbi:toll-like receptor 2 isoform X1 [Brienomyrus brachyistius]|uniref:toll-like receptor 2 isoform X1 n=2 Tax=Brienomyrus brachyistius TaxID=42636 RepID=UPI0020B3035E|nr:toll-like receptor 2 isoform X1 [Brienomyrus brachyistius]